VQAAWARVQVSTTLSCRGTNQWTANTDWPAKTS